MNIFHLDSEIALSPCRRNVFAFVTLFIMLLSVYSNTFDASWHFDDEYNILKNNNLQLKELNWQNIKNTFYASWDGRESLYRPAACLSLALNYYFGGIEVFGYHLINLLIHFVSSAFLFLFIHHTLNLPSLSEKYQASSYFIALLSTVFWAINPLQTQAVTYIVQRMASMAGMFFIAAMYFFLRARTSNTTLFRINFYFLFLLSGFLSVASKENAAILPIVIILYDLFLIQGITKENLKKFALLFFIAILMCILIAVCLKGHSILNFHNILPGYEIRGFTLIERLLTEPRVVLFYASLLFYPMPHRLCFFHDISVSKGLLDPPATLIAMLAIFILVGFSMINSKRWPLLSFCIIFFFLNHIVESTVFPLELVFEHRNYIPSMLVFIPVAALIAKGIRFFSYKQSMQLIVATFTVLAIVAVGHATFVRNFVWKTEGTLWLDAVEKCPNLARGHLGLGTFFSSIGLKQNALDQYNMALELPEGPNQRIHFLVNYNLGLIYKSKGDTGKAKNHFLNSLELEPRYPRAYTHLGILELEDGNYEKALKYFLTALTHEVNSQQERNYAGLVLLRQDNVEEAIRQFQRSLKANPADQSYILTHLGAAYNRKGDYDKASIYLKKALSADYRYVPAHLHLIESNLIRGDTKNAHQGADNLIGIFDDDDIPLLVNKLIRHDDTLVEYPNMHAVLPVIEKAILKKGDRFYEMASKLNNAISLHRPTPIRTNTARSN